MMQPIFTVYQKSSVFFILVMCSAISCSIFDSEDNPVAFVKVALPTLEVNSAKEGAATHNIKHAWATIDNQLLGVFPLPASIPTLIKNTNSRLQINWGVNDGGDNDSSQEYPFFNSEIIETTFQPLQQFDFPAKASYVKNAVFDVTEGFEQTNHVFIKDLDGNSNTRINLTNKDKASGEKSALLSMTIDNKIIEVTTGNYFNSANNKKGAVWLEFDYKSEEDLFIGYDIVTNSAEITEYKVGLKPTKSWKRAYVNFTKELSDTKVKEYRVAFKSIFTGKNGANVSEIYLDNIKLIHF
jgi:hypothetical protein